MREDHEPCEAAQLRRELVDGRKRCRAVEPGVGLVWPVGEHADMPARAPTDHLAERQRLQSFDIVHGLLLGGGHGGGSGRIPRAGDADQDRERPSSKDRQEASAHQSPRVDQLVTRPVVAHHRNPVHTSGRRLRKFFHRSVWGAKFGGACRDRRKTGPQPELRWVTGPPRCRGRSSSRRLTAVPRLSLRRNNGPRLSVSCLFAPGLGSLNGIVISATRTRDSLRLSFRYVMAIGSCRISSISVSSGAGDEIDARTSDRKAELE